jgi:hypothetical protein
MDGMICSHKTSALSTKYSYSTVSIIKTEWNDMYRPVAFFFQIEQSECKGQLVPA